MTSIRLLVITLAFSLITSSSFASASERLRYAILERDDLTAAQQAIDSAPDGFNVVAEVDRSTHANILMDYIGRHYIPNLQVFDFLYDRGATLTTIVDGVIQENALTVLLKHCHCYTEHNTRVVAQWLITKDPLLITTPALVWGNITPLGFTLVSAVCHKTLALQEPTASRVEMYQRKLSQFAWLAHHPDYQHFDTLIFKEASPREYHAYNPLDQETSALDHLRHAAANGVPSAQEVLDDLTQHYPEIFELEEAQRTAATAETGAALPLAAI